MKPLIHPQAEPFLFPGDDVGCLVLHGFTGAPAEVRLLGEHLAKQGRTVLGPRLFGHGTREEDLDRADYRDWLASAEDGYHMLRETCPRVVVAGLSMGAALSLMLAARFDVEAVIALSTAYKLPDDPRLALARPLSLIWKRVPKRGSDWHDPANRRFHYAYPHYPVPAILELVDLLADMRRSLTNVQAPTLLIQSKQDGSMGVPANAMPQIADALGSQHVETHWLEKSGHVITLDSERDLVFRHVSRFIDEVLSRNHPSDSTEEG